MKVGDWVKMEDADDPRSIPAYRDMRGRIEELRDNGAMKVAWFDRLYGHGIGRDEFPRDPATVVKVAS